MEFIIAAMVIPWNEMKYTMLIRFYRFFSKQVITGAFQDDFDFPRLLMIPQVEV